MNDAFADHVGHCAIYHGVVYEAPLFTRRAGDRGVLGDYLVEPQVPLEVLEFI